MVPVLTHGLPDNLDAAIRAAGKHFSPDDYVGVIGAGPLVLRSFENSSPEDWNVHLQRLNESIASAWTVAFAARASGSRATILFLTHPSRTLQQKNVMLNAVSESILRSFVQTGGIRAVNPSATCVIVSIHYTGWGFASSMQDAVDDAGIVEFVQYAASSAGRRLDRADVSLDRRGFLVTRIDGSSPVLGIDDRD